jgi:hypothetical protein
MMYYIEEVEDENVLGIICTQLGKRLGKVRKTGELSISASHIEKYYKLKGGSHDL